MKHVRGPVDAQMWSKVFEEIRKRVEDKVWNRLEDEVLDPVSVSDTSIPFSIKYQIEDDTR